MFADDVTLLATHRVKEKAEEQLQHLVDIVSAWILNLNVDKWEVCFFSSNAKEERAGHQRYLKYEPRPRLLGVTLDRQLCFRKHVDNVIRVMAFELIRVMAFSFA